MPDEVITDHSDKSPLPRARNAPAQEGPYETVVTDYTAVPMMIARLRGIHDAATSPQRKHLLTVVALLPVVFLGSEGDPRPVKQLLGLLQKGGPKLYRDFMRGMVAAAFAWLRAANIDGVGELDGLIKTNQQPFVLGFDGTNARRWFYDVKENRALPVTVDGFNLMAPDPSLSPTENEAKRHALEILQFVRLLNPRPLAGDRRRR